VFSNIIVIGHSGWKSTIKEVFKGVPIFYVVTSFSFSSFLFFFFLSIHGKSPCNKKNLFKLNLKVFKKIINWDSRSKFFTNFSQKQQNNVVFLCISIQFEWNPLMEMNKGLEDFKKKNKLQPPTNKITCIQYIYISVRSKRYVIGE